MVFARKEHEFLSEIGLSSRNLGCYVDGTWKANGPVVTSVNPANNQAIADVVEGSIEDYEEGMRACSEAAKIWMQVPAPKRGEVVRQIGDALRTKLQQLGRLVSLEMGKILPEGIGEVQEIIDMCDFSVGLSRQLNGSVIPSERPNHAMLEMWNPLGIVGVITAFNFPCAVVEPVVFGFNKMAPETRSQDARRVDDFQEVTTQRINGIEVKLQAQSDDLSQLKTMMMELATQQIAIKQALQTLSGEASSSQKHHSPQHPAAVMESEWVGEGSQPVYRSRRPRRDFPTFEGEEVHKWLYKCNQYFDLEEVPETDKLNFGLLLPGWHGALLAPKLHSQLRWTGGDLGRVCGCPMLSFWGTEGPIGRAYRA